MEKEKRKECANVPLTVCFNIQWCRISFFVDECGDNDDDDGNKCGDNGDDAVFLLFQVYWGEHHFLSKREPTWQFTSFSIKPSLSSSSSSTSTSSSSSPSSSSFYHHHHPYTFPKCFCPVYILPATMIPVTEKWKGKSQYYLTLSTTPIFTQIFLQYLSKTVYNIISPFLPHPPIFTQIFLQYLLKIV